MRTSMTFMTMTVTLIGLAPIGALEIPGVQGLTIDGYGEAYIQGGHRDAFNPRTPVTASTKPGDQSYVEFPSDAALRLRYVQQDFTLRTDIIVASQDQFNNQNVLLEQCFIDWKANPNLTFRAGRFQNTWLGWERFHTPELWRVNHSAAWEWNTQNHGLGPEQPFVSDGVGALLSTEDQRLTADFYVVNSVLGTPPGRQPIDKGYGASFAAKDTRLGRLELGTCIDSHAVNDGDGTTSNAFAVDVNTDVTAFRDNGWFLAAEVQAHRHPKLTIGGQRFGNDLVALGMANYRLPVAPIPMSVTAMVDYVQRGFHASNEEIMEYAFALLTKPRKHVLLNGEIFFWDEKHAEADAYGAAVVLLVMFP